MAENRPPRNQGATQSTSGPTGGGGGEGDPEPRRVSLIVPPDRRQQRMSDNGPYHPLLDHPNGIASSNRPRVSIVQQPSASDVSVPDKLPKSPRVRGQMLLRYQRLQSTGGFPVSADIETGKAKRSSAPEAFLNGRKSSSSGTTTGRVPQPPQQQRKLSKAEVEAYHSRIKTINKFRKSDSSGSLTSYNSTVSSVSSSHSASSSSPTGNEPGPGGGGGGGLDWFERWVVDRNGKRPGEIRGVKGVCFIGGGGGGARNSAAAVVAVTESRNARIQLFASSGRSLAVLGPDSDNDRTAASFSNPVSFRRMEPTGICESRVGLLAVTDRSRLVYIDASDSGRLLTEITVENRNCLHGIASTTDDKLIITEVGTQASVGLYETNGRLVREYKGDFKHPAYVAWNDDLAIAAVADSEQHAVYLYDANGALLNKLGKQLGSRRGASDEVGPLVYPSGVAWFSEGRLLVADRAENRVVLVDLKNMQAENLLTDRDGLGHPVALATNQKNRIVLTEEFHDFGVDKYNLKMFKIRRWNNDGDLNF